MRIQLNGISCPFQHFPEIRASDISTRKLVIHRPVTLASPFIAKPVACPTEAELWLDANIISQSTSRVPNPNITQAFDWAEKQGLTPSPTLALFEYFRTNPVDTAVDIIFKRLPIMEELYPVMFDLYTLGMQIDGIHNSYKEQKKYVKPISDYVIIIRHLYHVKLPFRQKCILFAKLIQDRLPEFLICYLIGCLYFFVKDRNNRSYWPEEVFSKIQRDMLLIADPVKARSSADNLASDIAYISSPLLMPLTARKNLRVAYIATSDAGLSFLLQEICYFAITIAGVGHGNPGYRPTGLAYNLIGPLVWDCINQHLINEKVEGSELETLHDLAEDLILNRTQLIEEIKMGMTPSEKEID